MLADVVESFTRDGFLGPVSLLKPRACQAILKHLQSDECPVPPVWFKGGAAADWLLSGLGANPRLLELLTPILGQDIILWGSELVRRGPGELHPWHVDIESSAPDGRFATAWIGLENTSGASSLRLIAGSHLCGKTVQQLRAENGSARTETSTETVLEWARNAIPGVRLVEPEVSDGEAILFDGRTWHGSHNTRKSGIRSALILQFAAADSPVRIPDGHLDWPFKFLNSPRPPAVVVQGAPTTRENQLVPLAKRPDGDQLPVLSSSIRKLKVPLTENRRDGWQRYPLFRGSTPAFASMSCHVAVLSAGHSPHRPHAHDDEELLMILHGQADLLIADQPAYEGAQAVRVKAGDFACYPALQHHTIRNSGDSPVTYMMFRWSGRAEGEGVDSLRPAIFRSPPQPDANGKRGFLTRRVFETPTRWLHKLHCHTSRLEVGAGYPAHADPYDIAIFIQSGRVKTLGHEVGAGSVIYYPTGEVHGMRNVGDQPARYIVFEFHGARESAAPRPAAQERQRRLAPVP